MSMPHRPRSAPEPRDRSSADTREFEAMFRAHYAAVCGYVRRLVGSMAVAEEIAQDVFARIWEREERFAYANPRTFLFVAAKRLALNHLRRCAVTARWRAAEQLLEPLAAAPDVDLGGDELAAAVRRAIEQLPPRTRAVYRLQREAHMSYADIARELGISIKTVEGQMGRALRMLRSSLAGYLAIVVAVLAQ
jgi:RNA polymerase sigma-70 factor (ECF subfamily)